MIRTSPEYQEMSGNGSPVTTQDSETFPPSTTLTVAFLAVAVGATIISIVYHEHPQPISYSPFTLTSIVADSVPASFVARQTNRAPSSTSNCALDMTTLSLSDTEYRGKEESGS